MPDEITSSAAPATVSEASSSPSVETTTSSAAPTSVETTPALVVSTPAVVTPPPAAEAGTEFKAPPRNPGEDAREYMRRTREAREAHEKGLPAPKPGETIQPALEAKPEVKVEEAKPADAVADPDALTPEEIEGEQGIATTELAAKLAADPELTAKLEAAGIKDAVFANARLADKAMKYTEIFPGGLEDANFAKEQASTFGELDVIASDVKDVDSVGAFYRALMPLSYVLDEDGKPIPHADGGFQTDGTINRIIGSTIRYGITQFPADVFKEVMASPQGKDLLVKQIQSLATGADDEELKAALEIVQERFGTRASAAKNEPQSGKEKELFDKEQSLKAEKEGLDRQRQTDSNQKAEDQERSVATDISSRMEKLIDSTFANFAIPPFNQKTAREAIRTALYERLSNDPVFKAQANQLSRKQYSAKAHTERVGLAIRTAKSLLMTVARPILKDAGADVIRKQEAKLAKINTQTETTQRTEPRGSSSPAGGMPQMTGAQEVQQAKESLAKKGNTSPSTSELLAERRVLKSGR
jgi:hypothetical protein